MIFRVSVRSNDGVCDDVENGTQQQNISLSSKQKQYRSGFGKLYGYDNAKNEKKKKLKLKSCYIFGETCCSILVVVRNNK